MSRHEMNSASMITCAGCKQSYADTALFCPNCGTPKEREAASDSLVGKLLGERFQVQDLIGQGASGTIYRAEHVTLRRKVAIKVLHTELSRDDLAVERFRREATTVAEIDNEHIVEIHDFGRTPDGRLYLAMELLEGETLDGVLAREKQLSVERTADILIQVGEALMEAHAIGYVHRDLRPRNVYLAVRRGKANFVKLLDFGLAKLVETDAQAASTSLGMTFGDPRYMSPEQARGDRIDRRADIYQLGCVAYEMLCGTPPFTGSRVFDILSKQVTEIPAPLPTRRPGVPLWMEAAVAKMLAKDPENRFATTTRMVEALRRGLETGEVMEDEIARRRESIPPPSVSRVMQKMGIPAPLDAPVNPPVVGKETMKGHLEGPGSTSAGFAPPVHAEPQRRRTGTPRVGVPIMPEPPRARSTEPPPNQVSVAGQIEAPRPKPPTVPPPVAPADAAPSGRAKRASSHGPGDSAAWFDDGDRASEEADHVRARKIVTPSSTDLSLYDEPLPRRRWPLVLGGLVALGLVGGTIAFALSRGDDKPAAPAMTAETAPPPTADVPPSQIIAPAETGSAIAAPPAPSPPPVAAKVKDAAAKEPKKTSSGGKGAGGGSRTPPDVDLGNDDASSRRPGGGFFNPTPTPDPVPTITPTPTPTPTNPTPTGVSGTDGPVDPYGGGPSDPPSDTASADKKAEFYSNLAQSQLGSGDTAGAAASFKKALELDPKSVPATVGMGEIALRQGLFGDAIAHLKKASRLAPKSSRVFTLLGDAYLHSGNNSVAAENFKKALQLDPENARAREGYNEASSKVPPPEDE
jgi:serine/threonine-protein kinase